MKASSSTPLKFTMQQPTLFGERGVDGIDDERVVLYALGDFQARGKVLIERELPLDRLRGALKRAVEVFAVEDLDDERAVATLSRLGAQVRRVPTFVAKHPFRVTVLAPLAEQARQFYENVTTQIKRQ